MSEAAGLRPGKVRMAHPLWKSIIDNELPLIVDGAGQIRRHAEEGDLYLVRQTLYSMEVAMQRIREAVRK